jgi:hypothetical protein
MLGPLATVPRVHTRTCPAVDLGGAHGARPCTRSVEIHCRRTGGEMCLRHESAHVSLVGCGQGEHEAIPAR